jgi:hypothetical protein
MAQHETADVPGPDEFADDSPNLAGDADLAVLGDALQEQGVTRVVIRYEGSGDSGGVDAVEVEPEEVSLARWVEGQLRKVAEGYCPDGCANDDGGYGNLTVYPALGLAALEHCDRYEDTEAMNVTAAPLPEGLRQRLGQLSVRQVTAHFDGYGDSGQIEHFEVEPENVALDDALQWELEAFLLAHLPGGWEINAGSFGDFTVEVASGSVAVEATTRIDQDADPQVARWTWRK